MGDMLHGRVFDGTNWFESFNLVLQSVAWVLHSTVSRITRYYPGQLSFNRDMVLQSTIEVDWQKLNRQKMLCYLKYNNAENKKRSAYKYFVGDQVLIINTDPMGCSKLASPKHGPYKVNRVINKGTLELSTNNYLEPISILRVKPYPSKE